MKITPIEIRQHTFEKGLRGYKSDDVDAFLVSLSQEWERVTGDYKMLKMQLELAEKELGKLKEVEMTLFRTLKSAEDNSAHISEQASKAAEQYLAEAKQKADDVLAEARKKSALMVQDAENRTRYLKDNMLNDFKTLEHDFKALENYKENLAVQIRALASNAVDSVDRFEKRFAKQNMKGKIDEVATQIKEELKQEPSQPNATAEPSVNALTEPLVQDNPVASLPDLAERETAVPEAIPVDEPMLAKLDEAIHPADHPEITPPVAAEADSAIEQLLPASTVDAVNAVEPAATPADVTEEPQAKKGGSFFDQI